MSHTRSVRRSCWAAGLPVALALGLLLGAWSAPTALPILSPTGPAPDSVGASALRVSIDPASWWMVAGNSTRFEATWTDVPPGCTSAPVWFRWSIIAGWGEGTLAPVDAPITNFTASSVVTGTAEVEVRSATVVDCGTAESAAYRNATANVTVVVPPILGPMALDTNPVAAGSPTNLTGTLVDGEPPYRVRVTWGDGSSSELNLSAPGPFSWPHRFPDGTFAPTVLVEDSVGLTTGGAVVEPIYSNTNFTVGIETGRYSTEVGASVAITGGMIDPPSLYSEASICSDALASGSSSLRAGPSASGAETHFSCAFASPGTAEITYEVIPAEGGLPPATATLSLPVRSALEIDVHLPDPSPEVGLPTAVAVEVSGGVAPFLVRWGLAGSPNGSGTTLAVDGTLLVPVDPTAAGSFGITVIVEDANGFEVGNSSVRLSVHGPLDASASVSTTVGPSGPVVSLMGSVTQGAGPFLWFVAPAVPPVNDTVLEGNLSVVSDFAWTGLVPREGNSSITVGVRDADGAVWWATIPVELIAPLEGTGRLTAVAGEPTSSLVLNLTLRGGLPPFTVWTNSSVRSDGNTSAPSDGEYSWSWPVNASGTVREQVVVVDRLGFRWSENATVNFTATAPGSPPPTPPSPPSPSPTAPSGPSSGTGGDRAIAEVAGISTLALLAAGGIAFYWRRRRAARAPPPPAPDPVSVLRGIIEPADGVDRATVELLAEEAGVALPTIRTTLGRLIADGRLRSETGSDGEEVYAWSPRDAP